MLQRLSLEIGRIVRPVVVFVLLSTLFAMSQSQALAETQPWMDTSLPPEQRSPRLT
jgi:hypothetical protein